MHGDDVGIRIIFEKGKQIVFINIGFIAKADDC